MGLNFDKRLTRLGKPVPAGPLRKLLRVLVGSRHVALMLHRVRTPSPDDWNTALAVAEEELDLTVEFLLSAFPRRTERWLTLTFDDGYDDAVAYVESRAPRYGSVDFIVFVCPEKTEHGVGFRWDLAEVLRQGGEPRQRISEMLGAPQDIERENAREDLRRVAADPQFRLASVERLRRIAEFPNVSIGNHTNCHFEASLLSPDQGRRELERSWESFARLFGPERDFAFPYGHGFFDESHLRVLRGLGQSVVWGTGQSPYLPADRVAGGVVPRIGLDGPLEFHGAAAVIAGRSLVTRILGVRPVARRGRRRTY